MKRILSLSLFAGLVAVLGGCPIYSDTGDYRVCDGNQCYDCPSNVYSSACVPWQCGSSLDCPSGYECGESGSCVSESSAEDAGVYSPGVDASTSSTCQPSSCPTGFNCGADGNCDLGDCTTSGCPSGWACVLEDGSASCAENVGAEDAGGTTIPPQDAGYVDSGSSVACQQSSECTNATADAGGGTALCLDGTCVPPVNQCYDGTQCPSGDKCVQGACTPICGGSVGCPTGYSCDQTNGVCTSDPSPCESNPAACTGGTVCSQNHCVTACGSGGTCPTNEQCLQGGCVPNQQPLFVCTTDGTQDACASGSICLHHSCYIACSTDAGPDAATACQSADQFNVCKAVTTSSGTYDVCGSSSNLGSECGPSVACPSSGICIDGYCH